MKRILIVGMNVRHATMAWPDLQKSFPQHTNPQFVSENPDKLRGINPRETTLILLPRHYMNPVTKHHAFQWLKENAANVIHIREEYK